MGDLLRIDPVIFVFATVDAAQVKSVGQDKSEASILAGVREPIPSKHAFAADGKIVTIRLNQFEEEVEVVVFDVGVDQLLALSIHDADVHLPGVEVYSAIELCGRGVILHLLLLVLVSQNTGSSRCGECC